MGIFTLERTPPAVGIDEFDVSQAAATRQVGNELHFRQDFIMEIHVKVTNGGDGAAGSMKIAVQPVDRAGNNLGPEIDLCTGIGTSTATDCVISLGGPAAQAVNGTLGGDADAWRAWDRAKLIAEVETQSDATTPKASVTIVSKR